MLNGLRDGTSILIYYLLIAVPINPDGSTVRAISIAICGVEMRSCLAQKHGHLI